MEILMFKVKDSTLPSTLHAHMMMMRYPHTHTHTRVRDVWCVSGEMRGVLISFLFSSAALWQAKYLPQLGDIPGHSLRLRGQEADEHPL